MVVMVSAVSGLVAGVLVLMQITTANGVQSIDSQDKAVAFVSNSMVPCPLRVQLTQQILQQLPAEVSVPTTLDATELDTRCPPMVNFASDITVQQQLWDEANRYTAMGVEYDPLLDLAWVLRSRYFLGIGDFAAAEAAAEEARRVQAIDPEANDPALVDQLFVDIAAAAAATAP